MKKTKKIWIVIAIVIGALILGAIVLGVLNALVANGKWSFGWSDYRYDESKFEIGEGSIVTNGLTHIEIDWIDGEVLVVPCDDTYVSVSEDSENELPESAQLRWSVSEDGKTLTVKYRKSSWFFSVGSGNRNKTLILRVPERFLSELNVLDIDVRSSKVTVENITAQRLEFESESGTLVTKNCTFHEISADSESGDMELGNVICPAKIDMESERGDLTLRLPQSASFALEWETVSGKLSTDFTLSKNGNRYVCADGVANFSAETRSGDILLAIMSE